MADEKLEGRVAIMPYHSVRYWMPGQPYAFMTETNSPKGTLQSTSFARVVGELLQETDTYQEDLAEIALLEEKANEVVRSVQKTLDYVDAACDYATRGLR